jgi:hypothetical protein
MGDAIIKSDVYGPRKPAAIVTERSLGENQIYFLSEGRDSE